MERSESNITIERVINLLKHKSYYSKRLANIQVIPSKGPVYKSLKIYPPDNIKNYLTAKNIRLYTHQCRAIENIREGKNVIITTPTASGKTFAFNIPVFEQLYMNKNSTALYLYPTKALSNDQLKVMKEMERYTQIKLNPEIYDGDTPSSKRPKIRESSRIIITNPYELHQILPWHYKWYKFFKKLKFVVIDEAHRYRGVFGSNVALLIRRLRRICFLYGSSPKFIISSATLANPLEFGEKLTGLSFELIDEDGSPRGGKYFVLYNPYFDGTGELSTHQEAKNLLLLFIREGLQTLCFTTSRKMAELIALWTKAELQKSESYLSEKVTAYRAGYLPEERRNIENRLKKGYLKGIVSTNALELGIDIGSLDSVIISGYPGTLISTWQQAGRAGRGTDESIVVLVAFQNPLDQYLMNHPYVIFDKPHEHAIVDLSNPYILSGHILCAASELPIKIENDMNYFGNNLEDFIEPLEEQKLLQKTSNGWVYSGRARATELVKLDNISSEIFRVVCENRLLEIMDRPQAFREAHKGAILLHQGETYVVEDMDLKNHIIQVKKKDIDYHTEAMKVVDIEIIEEIDNKRINNFNISFGKVNVSEQYIGYKVMKYDKIVGMHPIDLPTLNFRTAALWFIIPDDIRGNVKNDNLDFAGGIHGIEHSMIGIMPFHVMCDRWDIGGVSTPNHLDTKKPTVFIYDGFEGGIGLAEKAFGLIPEIIKMSYELVRDCKCESGCPGCIYSPKCGNENKPLDKKATILILKDLLDRMIH
jgi:DEAD/DEAH box helicase domain-containing protein